MKRISTTRIEGAVDALNWAINFLSYQDSYVYTKDIIRKLKIRKSELRKLVRNKKD